MAELFSIDFDWIAREAGDLIERTTLADLTITVRRNCLTQVEDRFAKTVRMSARLSAYALAKWLAWNWWRLRWEPERHSIPWRMSHKIGGAGEGYLWPDAAFISDGEAVAVISQPAAGREGQPVRYLNHVVEMIPAADFEREVDRFVEAVIGRLESQAEGDSELKSIWEEVLQERRTPGLAAYRKLEAIMGFDLFSHGIGRLRRLKSRERHGGWVPGRFLPRCFRICWGYDLGHCNRRMSRLAFL